MCYEQRCAAQAQLQNEACGSMATETEAEAGTAVLIPGFRLTGVAAAIACLRIYKIPLDTKPP